MKILVANLGSTSFKYRLFDMDDERQLARGGIDRIGSPESRCSVEIGPHRYETMLRVADHAEAVRQCLAQLTDPEHGCLRSADEVSAIGLKAVHGGRFTGVHRVSAEVLREMERLNHLAPAHNPPYVAAMRQLAERLPDIPLVAAFETGFHETIPARNRYYAVPFEWADAAFIQRWGFHGASHRYIAGRIAELTGRSSLRVVSCHLGGSSSLCAIRDGRSVANSFGMSPQSGLPQSNRVGLFDPFALPGLMRHLGKSLDDVLTVLASQSGLAGVSGTSGDARDLEEAAAAGNQRARLALELFVSEVRHWLGAYLVELGGADAIVFTGGIGENRASLREAICRDLGIFGIVLDARINREARGEAKVSGNTSRTEIWIVPTNEELIVARQTKELIEGKIA
jgi:acetate kinase